MADISEERILSAKNSPQEMELLLEEYRPLIVSAVLSVCPAGGDGAFQAGFMAFIQAVRLYDNKENGDFISFARTLIKRRAVDLMRREPAAAGDSEMYGCQDETDGDLSAACAQVYRLNTENEERKAEAELLARELLEWSVPVRQLSKASPRTEYAKNACKTIIYEMINNEQLLSRFKEEKRFPVNQLMQKTGIKRRVIDEHRKYIIAAVIIHTGDFPHMREYINLN